MATRNFWIDAYVDGRATELCGGPRAKDGGMNVTLCQRNEGLITTALQIICRECDGKLITQVYDPNNKLIFEYKTER